MPAYRSSAPRAALLALLLLVAAAGAGAEDLEVVPPAGPVVIGEDLELTLVLPAAAGNDPDAIDVAVEVTSGPQPPLLDDPYPLRAGEGSGRFQYAAPTRTGAHPGEYTLAVTVDSPAGESRWEGPVTVEFGGSWNAERIAYFIENRGLFLFFGLVFVFGMLMSATPCIYPMIPITLAVIGAQTQDKGVGRGFVLSLAYGLGLALVYGVIGVIAATVFSGITALLQSPVVLVPIALLMATLSFGMFGAYELEAPAFLRNRLQGAGGQRAGLFGSLLAGMVAGLIASPCVGPFLGGLMLWVGSTGSIFLGFWSLFVFGLGLSALLVAVGTFPSLMSNIPQAGGWMETVKRGMGLLLLYMAFFFVRPPLVLPETVFWPVLGGVTIVVAVFLGAFDRLEPQSHWWARTRKGLGILALLVGIWLLGRAAVPALLPEGLTSPRVASAPTAAMVAAGDPDAAGAVPGEQAAAVVPEKVTWEVIATGEGVGDFIDAKIAEARETGQPIMIDFWATWCVYCRKLDKEVWVEPEVATESLRFITIKVDATDPDDADMTAVKERFRVPGLPTVAFIDSTGRILHNKTLSGWHEADVFLETMQSIR